MYKKEDFKLQPGQVTVRNNLLYECSAADIVAIPSLTGEAESRIQESAFLLDLWEFDSNWRDEKGKGTIEILPTAAKDHLLDHNPFVSISPDDETFLQPDAKNLVSSSAAGPTLPSYVGAVPPADTDKWKWGWTWSSFFEGTLTVSQTAEGNAQFESIGAALDRVRPGMTIRVLDDSVYEETLSINQPMQHKQITLDAPQGATIKLTDGVSQTLLISDVPGVHIRGFRFTGSTLQQARPIAFVLIRGRCPGMKITDLSLSNPSKSVYGVVVLNAPLDDDDKPIIVRNCTIEGCLFGIAINGLPNAPTVRVRIEDNKIKSCSSGIALGRKYGRILIAGNIITDSTTVAIQSDNPSFAGRALITNNSCFNNEQSAIVFYMSPPHPPFAEQHLEVCNNMIMVCSIAGMMYARVEQGQRPKQADATFLLDLWSFHHNARDHTGGLAEQRFPAGRSDVELNSTDLASLKPTSQRFLQPKAASPLATQGAGTEHADLPAYIGAVPPEGSDKWNWNKTWQSKTLWQKKESNGESKE